MSPIGCRILAAIAVLAVVGIAVSSLSLYHHYEKSETSFCNINGTFNCDIVNRSVYSEVFGIPVALIGILGYAGLFAVAVFRRARPDAPRMLLAASLAGLAFALYLTYIEGYVLAAWCLLCLSSLAIIAAITALAGVLAVHQRSG